MADVPPPEALPPGVVNEESPSPNGEKADNSAESERRVDEVAKKYMHMEANGGSDQDKAMSEEEAPKAAPKPKPYNVFDFYRERGIIVRIAKSDIFEYVTLFIICVNAYWISYDVDYNRALDGDIMKAMPQFMIMENAFCFYFVLELLIRYFAFKGCLTCFKDGWFRFDFALVAMMVVETWLIPLMSSGGKSPLSGMSILRLLRLLRLTRMMRLMKALPELLVLIKGMVAASSAVASSMVLLLLSIYIFGIVFTSAFAKATEQDIIDRYGSLWLSCFHLFMAGTLLDNIIDVMYSLRDSPDAGLLYCFIMMVFVLLSSFTVLNMLIGVLCEVVTATADDEQEKIMIQEIRNEITAVFEEIDINGDGTVSKDEFEQMTVNPVVKEALLKVGVKPSHFFALSDVLFEPAEAKDGEPAHEQEPGQDAAGVKTKATKAGTASVELDFDEFLEMVINQRPEKTASVMDSALLRQMFRAMIVKMEDQVNLFSDTLFKTAGEFAKRDAEVLPGDSNEANPNERVDFDKAIMEAEALIAAHVQA
jgi:voltage-gated sodium channel